MEGDILDEDLHNEGLYITAESRMYLAETAKWAKFLAIVGFVFTGMFILLGIFFGSAMGALMANMPDQDGAGSISGMMGGFMGFMYVILGLLYLAPCYYLYKFAKKVKLALASDDTPTLTSAFENHKSVYKFWGIFMIVILGFYALGFVLALMGGLSTL